MDPAARIRWLGAQCGEFERQIQAAAAPDLVPRFRAGLEELVVVWERERGQTGEKVDSVAQLRKLRDWAASNGKPVPVIEEYLATYTKFSALLEDFRKGIFTPLQEAFPKHSGKKIRKVEKKLTTTLASWKDLLEEAPKVKNSGVTVDITSAEKKGRAHYGLEGLVPALQEKAQQALKLATKWGRLLEDDALKQDAKRSNDNVGHVSMTTGSDKTAKDKSREDRAGGSSRATSVSSISKHVHKQGQVQHNDKSLGAPVSVSHEDSTVVKSKVASPSNLAKEPRTTRHRKQSEVTCCLTTSTNTPTSTTSLEQKSRKEQPEIRQNRRESAKAAGKVVKTPVLLAEETSYLVVPKGKQTSKSLPSTPLGLFLPAAYTGAATTSLKHHRRSKSSTDQSLTNDSLQYPLGNNRTGQKLDVSKTSTGQAGTSPVSEAGKTEAHGRVSSAEYNSNAGFRKGISDLKTEFEQIRQDALMYEYSLERERATHTKKQLTDMEARKREIKEKLQEEKAVANFLTIGANVDRARDRVVQLQTELARVNARCVETEKRLQESSDRTATLAAGIKLWSENKTARRLEPIDRRASCKNGTGSSKGARQEGKALRL
ncbi:Hypp128 [Branchiostoma lanceolatum]|uniref:Hypp128 protein n=1 Tax=Branchiostoma lanceolatum TaxID=7740 RepID=A0A8J9V7P6_BRALA|nr:Hypp128 [Branchiostoma lanceolatum]